MNLIITTFLFSAVSLLPWGLQAQSFRNLSSNNKKALRCFEDGRTYYQNGRLDDAEQQFLKAIQEDPRFVEAYLLLGDVMADKKQTAKALIYYKQAIELKPDLFPKIHFVVANLERRLGHFAEAARYYENYLHYARDKDTLRNPEVRGALRAVMIADSIMRQPVDFRPENLGDQVNTAAAEYQPSLTADESLLVFTRLVPADKAGCPILTDKWSEDFFVSESQNGLWKRARNLGPPLNTPCNEGSQALSPDGRYMFFTACNRKDGLGRCDIYWSKRVGNGWSEPKNLGPPVNTSHWESQPSFASDGKTLYFVSNAPGGYGKSDIYYSELQPDGSWSKPVNLGPVINTPGEENSPFIHPDNKTLYFASDYHPGLGGQDFFVSRRLPDGSWSKPRNLGYPINSPADERSLIVTADGRWAYFASDKGEGFGDYDLYRFELPSLLAPEPVTYFKGIITDKKTGRPVEARFELTDLSTHQVVAAATSDPLTGSFLVCLPLFRNYALTASAPGYLFYSDHFELAQVATADQPFLRTVHLSPIETQESIILKNVFFDFNKAELNPASR
ncbi:MAG: tetratricopeptide repeat protein, partial [Flavobacteriales bacterium]|nr:tetratricopeptide repeat protein [Flavobacteriales bacterium]MDW8410280.1 tetratricopeptide repeat protein [Flavobacteriales bacterium]